MSQVISCKRTSGKSCQPGEFSVEDNDGNTWQVTVEWSKKDDGGLVCCYPIICMTSDIEPGDMLEERIFDAVGSALHKEDISVEAAASRLRDDAYKDAEFIDVYASVDQWDDQEILANAYLAEHPADDAEPMTLEWVGEVTGELLCEIGGDSSRAFVNAGGILTIHRDGRVFIQLKIVKPVKTRGDVRRLCAALGVELNEPEAPEAKAKQ